jgi:cytochrome c biogenesis protein CcdA
VWFLQAIARWRHLDQRETFIWGAAGAMTFDGLAIGFIPQLYGHTGQALAWVASALIFAFASLIIAGQLMLGRVLPAQRGPVSSPNERPRVIGGRWNGVRSAGGWLVGG